MISPPPADSTKSPRKKMNSTSPAISPSNTAPLSKSSSNYEIENRKKANSQNMNDKKTDEEKPENQNEVTKDDDKPSPYDVDYWTGEALHKRPLDGCSLKILDQVAEKVRTERDNLIYLGLYQDSVAANEAYAKTVGYRDVVQKRSVQKRTQKELYDRLEMARENHQRLVESAQTVIPNMISSFENEMANLENRQNWELQKLTEEWESPQKKRLYNRSSGALKNLRTQSILLLNSHRFDEMEICEKQANELEAKESRMNQNKLESDFQEALNKMLDRHQLERDKLIAAQTVSRDKYEAAVKHDLDIALKRIDKIEKEIEEAQDPEKVWVHYSRREAKGPPGKRPTARAGRKNCLVAINTSDFNTLNLPPLVDNPKWNIEKEPELPPRLAKVKEQKQQQMKQSRRQKS
ncbi:hypothetical protein TRFO_26045 [Tritrichomonas foetus]|uniref:Uncharacterized protein n=1 Tax=Tritrichomonas foetus TaxID=1144522 RepID=A0A1J4K3N1_9EUKA|nr:hypothetical protein TRFO_26045 [Tritrichomonas foetus]|eukprot:OHT05983.1 hypothetical protein TRFO_26045 [Tritrichomonas foetus]